MAKVRARLSSAISGEIIALLLRLPQTGPVLLAIDAIPAASMHDYHRLTPQLYRQFCLGRFDLLAD